LLDDRSPRDKTESYTIVEHGKAAACQKYIATIDAGDARAIGDTPVCQSSLCSDCLCGQLHLSVSQPRQHVRYKNKFAVPPLGQPLGNEKFSTLLHGSTYVSAKTGVRNSGVTINQLTVQPRRTDSPNLPFNRQVRPQLDQGAATMQRIVLPTLLREIAWNPPDAVCHAFNDAGAPKGFEAAHMRCDHVPWIGAGPRFGLRDPQMIVSAIQTVD